MEAGKFKYFVQDYIADSMLLLIILQLRFQHNELPPGSKFLSTRVILSSFLFKILLTYF